ncbi:MAG TPA: lysine-sensitive aspartokinase 3 [Terriglobales bacterium]|nr:lysine-sensitive aspartokinase 3 [Terriglobales bacterium]
MKFGGTSVEDASAIDRAAKIVAGRREQKPAVVVSAMSKVTDQLLAAGSAAGSGDAEKALNLSRALRERHYNAAGELLGTGVFTQFHGDLAADFDSLDELLRGIAAVGELTPRTTDLVASFGERMSSRMVTAAFVARDLPAAHVDSRTCVITDNDHMKAAPLFAEIDLRLGHRVSPLIEDGRIPILGGFIGSTREGATTTLGRGGSDFTAAIVGAGLNGERIEIWTDVDGMMTTDPRISKDARRIRNISFEEAAELAYFGAKVLHPATLLPAIQKDIPVYVLNSRNPDCEGTRISARTQPCRNLFKAIAAKRRITIVDVVATRMLMAHGFLKSIFDVFDRHRCPVDMVSTSEVSVSLTVDSTEAIPAIAADLEKLADVKYEGRKAIVCLVGQNIRGTRGIAARVFGALPDTNVRMISQGASEINISFVIDEDDVEETVRALHRVFFSDPDPAVFA